MATDRAFYLQRPDPETWRKCVVQMQTDAVRIRSLEDKLKSMEDTHSKCTMKTLDLKDTITVERRKRELKERVVEELNGEVATLQALVDKRVEWMEAVLGFLLNGADAKLEERQAQLTKLQWRVEELQRRNVERLLEQRRVSRQRERGIRLVFALKAREVQELHDKQMSELRKTVVLHEHEAGITAECARLTKERDAALERERTTAAQLALLQQKCQNPTQELVETLKDQVRHLQTEKDELVREEVRRLHGSSSITIENLKAQVRHMQAEREALVKEEIMRLQVGNEMRFLMQSRVIGDLRVRQDEMSRELRGREDELKDAAEQAKTLKVEYVKMFAEVRGLQEELCVRDRELRDARRQVDEMKKLKAPENMDGAGVLRDRLGDSTRMATEVLNLKGHGEEIELLETMTLPTMPVRKRRRVE
ncbi:hypothetical protein BDZ89DRAFT_720799 [Hymenopellis radicata]|nr:hypothetical protein BDZ89DRAFT_720799 [Hymenopellis radicata]